MGSRKILFVDRDGTLVPEPPDQQVDSLEKLFLVEGVIPAMLRLKDAGYAFVMVTNQDGLGSAAYPQAAWDLVQGRIVELFRSQGIGFEAVLVCPHRPADGCTCRKPHLGLVRGYLASGELDLDACAVVGDRETDLALAENMGLRGFRVGPGGVSWAEVARELVARPRRGERRRVTRETAITVKVELDREAPVTLASGIGFLDHMLDQLARHGGFGLVVQASGDLHVDEHHTVEDVAIALGEALRAALGDKAGAGRYGFVLPMDEALAGATVDLSGRPYYVLTGTLPRDRVGGLSTEMVDHFFRSLATALGAAIHLEVRGENTHHQVEGLFKALGRALRPALARGEGGVPSTKGVL
jgi:imidazoleglycerol-phosphate dehydratase/histidinol-phosphatase